MDLNIREIILQMINTLILFFVLKKIFFKPITQFLDARQKTIAEQFDQTEEELQQAAQLKQEYEQILNEARQEALAIIETATAQGQKTKEEIVESAYAEAEGIRERARSEAESSKEQALVYLRNQVADLASRAASVILEKEVDAAAQARLVDACIGELGADNEK